MQDKTLEDEEVIAQDNTHKTPEIREIHGTQEREQETYEEPTVHDEQITEEMNTANFRHDPETESEEGHIENTPEDTQDTQASATTTHRYNLWPRPTKCHDRLNLMQVTQQSTYADNAKPHLHVLMTQMSVKAGIKKFGKRGDDAVSKELRQIHDRKAMVPMCQYVKTTCLQKIGKRHYDI